MGMTTVYPISKLIRFYQKKEKVKLICKKSFIRTEQLKTATPCYENTPYPIVEVT